MEKDVLEKYKMNSRAEAVAFLKSLWNEAPPVSYTHLTLPTKA